MADLSFRIANFDFFFDKPAIERQLDSRSKRILSGTGAYGRKTMRSFIKPAPSGKRKQKRSSLFPRYHLHRNTGLRLVLFAYSPINRSVVIGPKHFGETVFTRTFKRGRVFQKNYKPVPQLLNEGGRALRKTRYKSGRSFRKILKYRKHPYADYAMVPTINKMQQLIEQIGLL